MTVIAFPEMAVVATFPQMHNSTCVEWNSENQLAFIGEDGNAAVFDAPSGELRRAKARRPKRTTARRRERDPDELSGWMSMEDFSSDQTLLRYFNKLRKIRMNEADKSQMESSDIRTNPSERNRTRGHKAGSADDGEYEEEEEESIRSSFDESGEEEGDENNAIFKEADDADEDAESPRYSEGTTTCLVWSPHDNSPLLAVGSSKKNVSIWSC